MPDFEPEAVTRNNLHPEKPTLERWGSSSGREDGQWLWAASCIQHQGCQLRRIRDVGYDGCAQRLEWTSLAANGTRSWPQSLQIWLPHPHGDAELMQSAF